MKISNRAGRIFKSLTRQIVNLVYDMKKEGATSAEIDRAVDKLIKNHKIGPRLRKWFAEEIQKVSAAAAAKAEINYTWVSKHSANPAGCEAMAELYLNFEARTKDIEKAIAKETASVIRENGKISELKDRLIHKLKRPEFYAATEANTGIAVAERVAFFEYAAEAEIEDFVYTGPAAEREECRDRLGKTYTNDELKTLKNNFGQLVKHHAGGYNCRHGLDAVIPEKFRK